MFKRFLSFVSAVCLAALLLTSCRGGSADCLAAMKEVAYELNLYTPIYTPRAKEGEEGYCREGFLYSLYGIDEGAVLDFAIIFTSTLDKFGEAAVFYCHTEYDARAMLDAARGRLRRALSSGGELDLSAIRSAEVGKVGRTVFVCALGDDGRAARIIEQYCR